MVLMVVLVTTASVDCGWATVYGFYGVSVWLATPQFSREATWTP